MSRLPSVPPDTGWDQLSAADRDRLAGQLARPSRRRTNCRRRSDDPAPAPLTGLPAGDGPVLADHLDLPQMQARVAHGLLRPGHPADAGHLRIWCLAPDCSMRMRLAGRPAPVVSFRSFTTLRLPALPRGSLTHGHAGVHDRVAGAVAAVAAWPRRSRVVHGPAGILVRCRTTRPSTSALLPTIVTAAPRTHRSSRPSWPGRRAWMGPAAFGCGLRPWCAYRPPRSSVRARGRSGP